MEGETLTLTCSVESVPPAVITWTRLVDKDEPNATESSQRHSSIGNNASLGQQESSYTIANVSAADSGQYVCAVEHMNTTLEKIADVRVNCEYRVDFCPCHNTRAHVGGDWKPVLCPNVTSRFIWLFFFLVYKFHFTVTIGEMNVALRQEDACDLRQHHRGGGRRSQSDLRR